MIPKRAIFYWEGKPMDWLRRQAIHSFRILNPGWEVEIITGDWPVGDTWRFTPLRSDYARYKALADRGGFYFDTDIVFVRPIPDSWLVQPLAAPLDDQRKIAHIAAIGSVAGHRFFLQMLRDCHERAARNRVLACQSFGTLALSRYRMDQDTFGIPVEAFITHHPSEIEKIWSDPIEVPSWSIGVHWYGGDRVSEEIEPQYNERTWANWNNIVGQALTVTLGRSAEAETLCEQHGIQ